MEYNTSRKLMVISEYGRNVQRMVDHAVSIEDREERNRAAKNITAVMALVNPGSRDQTEYKQKLWDHLFIMADFKLDVDSPFPLPTAHSVALKPKKLKYPDNDMRFRHYGRIIEKIVRKAILMEDGEEKSALVELIANFLKKCYILWNKEFVSDEVIYEHLSLLSKGKLKMDESIRLVAPGDVQPNLTNQSGGAAAGRNRKRKKNNQRQSGGRRKF